MGEARQRRLSRYEQLYDGICDRAEKRHVRLKEVIEGWLDVPDRSGLGLFVANPCGNLINNISPIVFPQGDFRW